MPLTPDQARLALDTVERGRLWVIAEIGLPRWYWWGLALGWIAVGVITDLHNPWATAAITLAFGAVHALIVVGIVAALGCLTVGLALAAHADGARDPVTIASLFIATIIVLGRPQLIAVIGRRAARTSGR